MYAISIGQTIVHDNLPQLDWWLWLDGLIRGLCILTCSTHIYFFYSGTWKGLHMIIFPNLIDGYGSMGGSMHTHFVLFTFNFLWWNMEGIALWNKVRVRVRALADPTPPMSLYQLRCVVLMYQFVKDNL
jgi:hypothetical protein